MTKIKYCGLTREQDIKVVNQLKIDYVGFMFFKNSKRYISNESARLLKNKLLPEIKSVGVFVNENIENIGALHKEGIIDIIQLHGKEDNDYITELKKITKAPVIKAYSIQSEYDIEHANNSVADMVLLDSGSGGTGKVFNWDMLKGINRDYFLAGGLNVSNVQQAIDTLHPYGVDVSSGIETDGLKDKNLMIKFAELIRGE